MSEPSLLLLKVALLAATVAAALFARRHLRRRDRATSPDLRRWAGVELGALAIVVGVTGVLQSGVPARDGYGPSITRTAPLGADTLRVTVSRTHSGPLTIRVARLHEGRVSPLEDLDGRLTADIDGATTLLVTFRRSGGTWRSSDAQAPFPGHWRLQLDAEIDDGLAYATSVSFRVW